jgi:Family of unknown function (DUF6086)
MSRYFQVGDQVLWNPSNGVAELFASTAEALVSTADAPTGIGPMEAHEYEIDLDTFGAFVDALVRRYVASRHPIFRCLLEGFTATALVMVQRGGEQLVGCDPRRFRSGQHRRDRLPDPPPRPTAVAPTDPDRNQARNDADPRGDLPMHHEPTSSRMTRPFRFGVVARSQLARDDQPDVKAPG